MVTRSSGRRIVLLAAVAALLAAASAALPGRANASEPSGALSALLSPNECVGQTEEQNKEPNALCGTDVPFGLSFAYEAQVSPEGDNVYSVAINGALIEYARNQATGALSVIGCITATTEACASGAQEQTNVAVMAKPTALAISPNGQDVYVAVASHNAVVEFEREAATGLLTFMSSGKACVTGEAGGECEITEAAGFNEPYGIAVSPNGESVYVASVKGKSVAELARNTTTGLLEKLVGQECVGGPGSGCPEETAQALTEPIGVVVSPDDENVYVAAGTSSKEGEIASFKREANGALSQLPGATGCISSEITHECTSGIAVDGSENLVVSPDGKNVYATSFAENAVVELERDPSTGALAQLASPNACISTTSITGCTTVKAIGGTRGLAISPSGEDVYVTSTGESSVAAFKRQASGALASFESPYECVTTGLTGCGTTGAIGLEGARRLTISPDGTNVYLAAQEGHSLAELARTIKPAVTVVTPDHGTEAGGATVTIRGSGFAEGAIVEFEASPSQKVQAASVTVNSASSITALTPSGLSGATRVIVANPAGESASVASDTYSFTDAPVVSGVSPSGGVKTGGTEVTISGSGFLAGASVQFEGRLATSVHFNSETSLTAISPPGTGTANVTVSTTGGTSAVSENDHFDYLSGAPAKLGGLDIAFYCESLGYGGDGKGAVALARGAVEGPAYAYENWACIESDGAEVLIANAGPAPSEEGVCAQQYAGRPAIAIAENPDSAFSWNCYERPAEGGGAGGGEKGSGAGSGGGGGGAKAASVSPPTLAKTGNVAPVSGSVLVKLPGAKGFVALTTLTQVPFGSVIEAANGHVSVTVAQPGGGAETGEFFDGQFVLTQEADGMTVATLTGGNFAVCPRRYKTPPPAGAAIISSASGKHVVRKLWANAHGKFTTKGNYAAGAVQGTEWLTEDLCEGTLIRVTRDKVAVTNLVTRKHIEVRTGHRYLARAPLRKPRHA